MSGGGIGFALRAFRHRDFRIFWVGAIASNTGTWLSNLTVPYVLFQLTHSAVWVALATVGLTLPAVLFGPWGGSLADRHDRRGVLLVTQTAQAASVVALWLLWISGGATPWTIVAAVAFGGAFNGLNMPVWQAFTNDLVPRGDLGSAIALNSLQFNAARALGPALAGAIIALLSPGWAFGVNAVSFGCVLIALALIHSRTRRAVVGSHGVLRDFGSAVRYVGGQPGIQMAILLSILVGLFGNPIFTVTVVFAGDVFHVSAIGLGAMNAAIGVGCLLVAPLVAGGLPRLTLGRLTRIALPLFGLSLGGFALAPSFWAAILLLVATGACFMSVIASANSAIQMIVAPSMRGRVIGVRIAFFTASMPVGSMLQGWEADLIGPRIAVLTSGLALLAAGVVLSGLSRGRWLRRLDDPIDDSDVPRPSTAPSLTPARVPHSGTRSSAQA